MQISDHERRDAMKFLEAGKPLPDKYRFLLFDDQREVELVWNGKSREVCNVALPFQVIEQVDEPRVEATEPQEDLFATDARGRQLQGWSNKLIWGDNKLILSSLKNGPLRAEIEAQGGLRLIYIDPPFDVGADFSMDIEIGGDTFTKTPNVLEELVYRDTWGKGADSFIAMIYERLPLMRDLLAADGSIYVHCDWRVSGYIRLVLDEVFGRVNFVNEIIWCRTSSSPKKSGSNENTRAASFGRAHDSIFVFARDIQQFQGVSKNQYTSVEYSKRVQRSVSVDEKTGEHVYKRGRGSIGGKPLAPKVPVNIKGGTLARSYWVDIPILRHNSQDYLGYPTQKPGKLLMRILAGSSNEGDLVADFFCGSGTTAAMAEKLGRKWIATDLGKFAIHTTRKRMIGVQRQLKADRKDYRAFEILNLGKYERQHYIGVTPGLRPEQREQQLAAKSKEYQDLILKAYAAQSVAHSSVFHGKKAGRMVAIGPINLPVTRLFVEEIILECRQQRVTRADILAFEFEMGLFPNILEEAKGKGINLAMRYIPEDVFDRRAVQKNQVVFHDVSYIEVKPHITKGEKNQPATVAVELSDFSVYYPQDRRAETSIKNGKSKIIAEQGQIVRISKDKQGAISREILTKHWTDWIDYWAVDFDFESKREISRDRNEDSGETEERWRGDFIFENEWQSFRTKKDRSLELTSIAHECKTGRRKIAVKVVDLFGNDTMKIVEVGV